jgi:hypothetical protein
MATMAFFAPLRRAMRRERSPRKVSVLAAATAASPSIRARYGLPFAVTGAAGAFLLPRGFGDSGCELRPGTQVSRGGETPHVEPDLGDGHLRGRATDPGDLIELFHRMGERGNQLLDPALDSDDVGGDRIHPGQHRGQQERVMVGEIPGERLLQPDDLATHRGTGQLRQHLRVPLTRDQGGHHVPAGDPWNDLA